MVSRAMGADQRREVNGCESHSAQYTRIRPVLKPGIRSG